MADELYKQCKLSKGNTHHVAWIPERRAKLGAIIKIKENEVWVDGHLVEEVYAGTMTHQALVENDKNNKRFGQSIRGD